jgi:hypothetical protein
MNERIKELYKQAHSIRYYDGDPMRDGNPPTVYWEGEVSAAKFAELIILECMDVLEDFTSDINVRGNEYTVVDARETLEEHFGIKGD